MNLYEFLPIKLLIIAAYWVVTRISDLLEPIAGSASAALAIVLLTMLVRACLIPVGRSQMKAGITRQRLAPKIAELQRRYRNQPEVLQRKTMELYSSEHASPFAGCLPVLAQTPVLMAVYGLFILPTVDGHANELLGHRLFGTPLSARLVEEIASGTITWGSGLLFLGIMVVIAVVAQASRKLLAQSQPVAQPQPVAPRQEGVPDLSGLTKALSFMPFMTAIVAAFVPLAAALYLMTSTTWTLAERWILGRTLRVKSAADPGV